MQVECKIKRKGGSRIVMADGTVYHFAPQADGRHVADVDNLAHLARFQEIPEGYRIDKAGLADAGLSERPEPPPPPGEPIKRRPGRPRKVSPSGPDE